VFDVNVLYQVIAIVVSAIATGIAFDVLGRVFRRNVRLRPHQLKTTFDDAWPELTEPELPRPLTEERQSWMQLLGERRLRLLRLKDLLRWNVEALRRYEGEVARLKSEIAQIETELGEGQPYRDT
jgi:hypothetical protein